MDCWVTPGNDEEGYDGVVQTNIVAVVRPRKR
jgi:hypothetical protein